MPTQNVSQNTAATDIEALGQNIILLIKNRNIAELAVHIHPEKGVSISPSGYIDKDRVVLMPGEISEAWKSNRVMRWGDYDGTGDPIEMGIRQYFTEFVYAADYANAPVIAVNRIIGQGNTIININEAFPGSSFIEFHFPGFNPQFEGMDWSSLRLLFLPKPDHGWWLVAVVNDQWTI